jgi:hypothetical protein
VETFEVTSPERNALKSRGGTPFGRKNTGISWTQKKLRSGSVEPPKTQLNTTISEGFVPKYTANGDVFANRELEIVDDQVMMTTATKSELLEHTPCKLSIKCSYAPL